MRIGGLASGIDTEAIIQDLMQAERIPMDKMEQNRQTLEWQRDAFREINTMLFELDEMAFDLKLQRNFMTKSFQSTQEQAVTARGGAGAVEGNYRIEVEQLATAAMNFSTNAIENLDGPIDSTYHGTHIFYTFDEEGKEVPHTFEVKEGDTVRDVLQRINDDPDNANVRFTYDVTSNRVIMEATRTGKYNTNEEYSGVYDGVAGSKEIVFQNVGEGDYTNKFFTEVLQLNEGNEQGGQNASIKYNGYYEVNDLRDNNFTINNITFEFHAETDGVANISVQNNVDETVNQITEFVEKYNEIIEKINDAVREPRNRDFPPLTEAQREDMTEREIELWEEKAKSGLLRGDAILSSALSSLRQNWYAQVETGGAFTTLAQIGITTTSDYMDGGKLEIDETELRKALEEDQEAVFNLFSNSDGGASKGVLNRLEDTLDRTMERINERAGRGTTATLEAYSLGRRMKDVDDRMAAFERRLEQVEARYWSQFSRMEQAISMMNNQSMMLMSQFMPQQ